MLHNKIIHTTNTHANNIPVLYTSHVLVNKFATYLIPSFT